MIIGIDYGHCETTASRFDEFLTGNGKIECKVNSLNVDEKSTVIPTQIILTKAHMELLKGHKSPEFKLLEQIENNTAQDFDIGMNLREEGPNEEKFIYFKRCPDEFDKLCGESQVAKEAGITHGTVMACFIYALLKRIRRYNPEIRDMSSKNIDLLIGCPASNKWCEKESRKKYSNLIKRATGVNSVRIIPESSAALFSSVNKNLDYEISISDGIAVFDFGSSTTDFTYFTVEDKPDAVMLSWDLGANEIERNMAFDLTDEKFFNNEPFNELRKVKEGYYNDTYIDPYTGVVDEPMRLKARLKNGTKKNLDYTLTDDFMNEAIKNSICEIDANGREKAGSWYELCESFFVEARNLLGNRGLKYIVLSGGASKMPFVRGLCERVFPKANIIPDNNPSIVVSDGLGWIALSDSKFDDCMTNIIDAVGKNPSLSADSLQTVIGDSVYNSVIKKIEPLIDEWANANEDKSATDLQELITHHFSKADFDSELKHCFESATVEWKKKFSKELTDIINNKVKNIYSPCMHEAFVKPMIEKVLDVQIDANIDASCIADKIISKNIIATFALLTPAVVVAALVILVMRKFNKKWADEIYEFAINNRNKIYENWLNKKLSQQKRMNEANNIKEKLKDSRMKSKLLKQFNEEFEEQTKNFDSDVYTLVNNLLEMVTLKNLRD